MRLTVAIPVVILVLIPILAGVPAPAQTPVDVDYRDKLLDSAPIGLTSVLVGLEREPFPATPDAARLWIDPPTDWAGATVCVRALSSDARYSGLGHASLPAAVSGPTELRIDPNALREKGGHPEFLAEKAVEGTLAILVQRGPCGDRPVKGSPTAIARWSGDAVGADIAAFVNSTNADRVTARLVGTDGSKLTPVTDCPRVTEDAGVAYDHFCRLDISGAAGASGVTLVIERIRGGNPDEQPVRVPLAIGD